MEDKYYFLGLIVDDFLDDNNLHNSFFAKAFKWAQRAVRNIRLDVFQHPKTVLLDVTERRTIVLPDGYVDWTKVAAKRGQYAVTLAVNDDMTINERHIGDDVVKGLLSQNMPNGIDFSQYGGYTFFNYNGVNMPCIGGGLQSKGHFKFVDNGACKEIFLDYDYSLKQVYLEYITDGLSPCKETVVHPYEYDYILAFMEEMYAKKNDPKATNYSKEEAGRDVFFAERKMRGRFNNLDPKTLITISRSEARLTPKL